MPLLLLAAGLIGLPLFGAAVNNATTPTTQTPQNAEQSATSGIKWVVIIAGSVLAIKYGSKLIKKI